MICQFENLKTIQKEIDAVKGDYLELEMLVNCGKDKSAGGIDKIEKAKQKSLQKLLVMYNQLNDELMKIEDERVRVIIRYKVKGWTNEKIGDELGYSEGSIRYLLKQYEETNKCQ